MNEQMISFLAYKHFKKNPSNKWFEEKAGKQAVDMYCMLWNRYPDKLVRELRLRWVQIRLTETNWSLKRIAREVSVSEDALRQEFQEVFQKSPEMYRKFWQSLDE